MALIERLVRDERGRETFEVALLLAFAALASAALCTGAGRSGSGIWTTARSRFAATQKGAD